jgi:hypothetical protein
MLPFCVREGGWKRIVWLYRCVWVFGTFYAFPNSVSLYIMHPIHTTKVKSNNKKSTISNLIYEKNFDKSFLLQT